MLIAEHLPHCDSLAAHGHAFKYSVLTFLRRLDMHAANRVSFLTVQYVSSAS